MLTESIQELSFNIYSVINNLPQKLSFHKLEGKNLIIAPENPSWIVLSDYGIEILRILRNNGKIIDAYLFLQQEYNLTQEVIENEIYTFLQQVIEKDFFENAVKQYKNTFIKLAFLHVTDLCNMPCALCNYGSASPRASKRINWVKVIEDVAEWAPDGEVYFVGGEVLLHPDAITFFRLAKELGLTTYIKTNGSSLNSYHDTEEILQYIDHIDIYCDGATKEVQDAIRQEGSFAKILKATKILEKLEREYRIKLIVLKNNIENIRSHVKNFHNLFNPEFAMIDFSMHKNNLALPINYRVTYKDFYNLINDINIQIPPEKATSHNTNIEAKNCAFGYKASISSSGNVSPCHAYSYIIGNVLNNNFKEIMEEMSVLNKITTVEHYDECAICDLKYICSGRCKVEFYNQNSTFLSSACTETHKLSYYKTLLIT